MRKIHALLLLSVALLSCTAQHDASEPEDFDIAFKKMQEDPEFLIARAHPGLVVAEEMRWGDGDRVETRVIPCGLRELAAGGWSVLPGAGRLAHTGTTYSLPERIGADRVAVTLGPAEGTADAMYYFNLIATEWQLMRIEVYSQLEPDAPIPAHPCSPGHRPNSSFKPKPLRGSA